MFEKYVAYFSKSKGVFTKFLIGSVMIILMLVLFAEMPTHAALYAYVFIISVGVFLVGSFGFWGVVKSVLGFASAFLMLYFNTLHYRTGIAQHWILSAFFLIICLYLIHINIMEFERERK